MKVERIHLAPDLSIARVLTGMWQIADMEKNGRLVDLDSVATAMVPYVKANFSTFDMADHYGSAELIAGVYHKKFSTEGPVQFLTKWVPAPGNVTKNDVRAAVQRAIDQLSGNS